MMRIHRSIGRRAGVDIYVTWIDQGRRASKKRRKDGGEPGGVPVEPDRPSTLSGGAAAAMEFDE